MQRSSFLKKKAGAEARLPNELGRFAQVKNHKNRMISSDELGVVNYHPCFHFCAILMAVSNIYTDQFSIFQSVLAREDWRNFSCASE